MSGVQTVRLLQDLFNIPFMNISQPSGASILQFPPLTVCLCYIMIFNIKLCNHNSLANVLYTCSLSGPHK